MIDLAPNRSLVQRLAQAGLIAKGVLYSLLGALAFMAAFHINGHSTQEADTSGVLGFIHEQTGGQLLLGAIAVGLACYSLWRGIQAFGDTEREGRDAKGWASRGRYLLSGLAYASLAFAAARLLFSGSGSSGDQKQQLAQETLSKPFGAVVTGIAALVLIGIGVFQFYYAYKEKYLKHVDGDTSATLRLAGKIGYCARGAVWILLGWLFGKAALSSNAREAGDTSKAFGFLSDGGYGTYLLAVIGAGLLCYGVFNFIRARHERPGRGHY
ncbi:DUF1206 domain-containing protein [Flaviaesturariibacter amylovorans]|uniref:DUF1206 domain-containing protein n=1 Tax=Flaviaesturariibacter amylovorans TaxID=1084520 RepID=A0ABP8H7T1_9BACT